MKELDEMEVCKNCSHKFSDSMEKFKMGVGYYEAGLLDLIINHMEHKHEVSK